MKKHLKLILIILLILLLIWPYPFPARQITYRDGGTKEYFSLTYRIIWWNVSVLDEEQLSPGQAAINHSVKVYFFPNNFKSIDTLWEEAGN